MLYVTLLRLFGGAPRRRADRRGTAAATRRAAFWLQAGVAALLLLAAAGGIISAVSPAAQPVSGPVYTPSQVRDGLRRRPASWLNRTVRVRGTIGGECPPPPGGGILNAENCALPPAGEPFFWISDGSTRPPRFDPRRSLGLSWVWTAPPAPAHPQWDHSAAYPIYIHVAAPCPEEMGPRSCILGAHGSIPVHRTIVLLFSFVVEWWADERDCPSHTARDHERRRSRAKARTKAA